MKNCLDFDVEIYISGDVGMIKFDRFTWLSNEEDESICVNEKYLGKWIECPSAFAAEFLSTVDTFNRNFFTELRELIVDGMQDDGKEDEFVFENTGDVYTVNVNEENEYEYNGYTYSCSEDAEFTLDLSTPDSPYIEFGAKIKQNYHSSSSTTWGKYSFVFSNINNTVIKFNIDPDYSFDDIDELDERVFTVS